MVVIPRLLVGSVLLERERGLRKKKAADPE
jgi:hypothetical protein